MYFFRLISLSLFLAFSLRTQAQISAKEKKTILADIFKVLQAKYVFPDVAATMQKSVLKRYNQGKYDTITSGQEFAFQITQDLQHISKDQHLKVTYYAAAIPAEQKTPENNAEAQQEQNTWLNNLLKENNFGIKEKKVLPGNIGYLNIPMFGPLNRCADTLITAMRSIENTDALVIDLRSCRGSLDENTIPFICSYFFKESVHLFDFYTRETNFTKQFWTTAWLPEKQYLNKPIFILTSSRTFSGGEEMAYDLKALKRAVLIGEKTRGGANPTELVTATPHYKVSVPYARLINPITKTNWEQIGVAPDSLVKSNLALYAAHLSALTQLLENTPDQNKKLALATDIKLVKAAKPQFKIISFRLKGFEDAKEVTVAGSFNFWAKKDLKLKKVGNTWIGEAEVAPGPLSYMFIIDGRWLNDPENTKTIQEGDRLSSLRIVEK